MIVLACSGMDMLFGLLVVAAAAFCGVIALLTGASACFVWLLRQSHFRFVRETLAKPAFKPLACAIIFSPAITVAVLRTMPFTLSSVIPVMPWDSGPFLTLIGCAVLGACWLFVPEDPGERIRLRQVVPVSVLLWMLGAFMFFAVKTSA